MDKDVVTVYPSAGHGNIRWKNLAKVIVFLLVFVLIFIWLQDIMTPNRDLPDTTVRFKKSVRGLLQEEKNTIDALWLGTSHVYSGIIPMELYRASGLRSHLLSGSSQRVPVAYYLLKNAFKEQSPSFVFIDASSFFIRKNEQLSYWQTAIDALPFSDMDIRIEMAAEAAGLNESAFDDDYIAMSVLPLLQYHTHVDLQEKDFYDLHLEQVYYRKGYVMNTRMSPVDKDDYDAIKAKLAQQPGSAEYTEEKIALEQEAQGNLGYIKDMVRLCRENGSQLIFIKVPTYITSSKYGGYWSRTKHDIVQELADEYQVTFLDLNYENVGLDWQTDTKDGGKHLNLYGATKVTEFLSDWIVHNLDVPVNDDADLKRRWDYQLKLYDMERNIYLLCNIKDHKEYFEKIRDGRYTLLISSHGDLSELWTEELQRDFEKLTGSTMDFRDLGGSSAVVLSSDGKVLDELADPADCRIGGELPGNISFSIRGNVDSASRIRVDRTILKITRYTGLQIVVFDNELGWVVDCVNVMPGLQDDVTSETKAAIIIRNNPFKKKFYIKMKDYIDMKMAVL